MSQNNYIQYSLSAGVATITLNRPEVYNSFNEEMALTMQQYLRDCGKDDAVRAIVITGAGKAFCAGQDLGTATDPETLDLEAIVKKQYNPIVKQIRELEKPVIAAVNGVAAGAGANLALCCDIVVARESAAFIQAFSKIGLIPDCGGTFLLPRLIGMQRASALMLTGDKVGAKEALEMGMLYKVFADDAFEGEVTALAQRMAQMPTKGIAYTKMLLNQAFETNLEQQLTDEAHWQSKAGKTHDFIEGVQAFVQKRKPTFTGQ
jgi:2-(1,2-epoxy-1,2-dihydrophenyl)acetyl-CoA isomerase